MNKTMPSGAQLSVSAAPFEDAMALQDGVLNACKGVPMPGSLEDLMGMDATPLKDAILAAATSKELREALFTCAKHAIYDGKVKVDRALFDDPILGEKARGDYYTIAWELIVVNCGPFFVKTFSWLKTTTASNPASK